MSRPNILILFTDDQRFDTIHALGNNQIKTPAMDSLVEGGTAFTQAHIPGGTSGAVCMPSRAMLMTGRTLFNLHQAGRTIPDDHVLMGEWLQEQGYRTFGTGKWHNSPASYARSFTDGAEIFFGGMDDHWNVPACDFDPTGRYEDRRRVIRDPFRGNEVLERNCDHITPGKHSSELFCDAAAEWIRSYDDDAPFFAYVAFMAPHDPRTMPDEFRDLYNPDEIELPPNFMPQHPFDNGELHVRDETLEAFPRTPGAIKRHLAEYYGILSHADAQIQNVLDALEETGQRENTLIVFAGDNGLAIGQHGLMGKQSLYDHSVRVPLIFNGPGIPAGQRTASLCYLLDIFPTLADLLGAEVPDSVQGQSLLPTIQTPELPARTALYLSYMWCQRAVREGDFKLIRYASEEKQRTQLFNLKDDPWETQNLSEDPAHVERIDRLWARMQSMRDEMNDTLPVYAEPFWKVWE